MLRRLKHSKIEIVVPKEERKKERKKKNTYNVTNAMQQKLRSIQLVKQFFTFYGT
jgi:hypothetical protein